jgi:hypothetical protein
MFGSLVCSLTEFVEKVSFRALFEENRIARRIREISNFLGLSRLDYTRNVCVYVTEKSSQESRSIEEEMEKRASL